MISSESKKRLNNYRGDPTGKGDIGEEIVMDLLRYFKPIVPVSRIYLSYEFPQTKSLPGNIKYDEAGRHFFIQDGGGNTEIDILLLTEFSIFCIEVKAYKSPAIKISDLWIEGVKSRQKSPIHQNEMHQRHLYEQIYRALPDGQSKFIKSMVCFVDNCKILDRRADKSTAIISIPNTMLTDLANNMLVSQEYKIDMAAIETILDTVGTYKRKVM